MPAPATGACDAWVAWCDLPCDIDLSELPMDTETLQGLIVTAASDWLYEETCRQFGVCTVTARPMVCCRHKNPHCACGRYPYLDLGTTPVAAVTTVVVDGVTLDADAYRVDEWRYLVRVDGDDWPACQHFDTDDGVTVTWTQGVAVPAMGVLAAQALACKLAHDVVDSCGAPPSNAEAISREGVTINLAPPKPGETVGIQLVDNWVARHRCGGGIFDPGNAAPGAWRTGT